MSSKDGPPGGAGASRDEKADASRPTGQQERLPSFLWILHPLMFLAGLGLLSLADSLESLNGDLRAADRRDAFLSKVHLVRGSLQGTVGTAGASLLALSATGLVLTWCQRRWPRAFADWPSREWRRRYRLPLPAAHSRLNRKCLLLMYGVAYGWALGYAILPTVLAFHLVPTLYDPVPAASPTALTRALQLMHRARSVLSLTFGVTCLVLLVGMFHASTWRLRRMESWLDRGVPVCLACGYPLRGLDSPACPECGTAWSQWYPSKEGGPVLPT